MKCEVSKVYFLSITLFLCGIISIVTCEEKDTVLMTGLDGKNTETSNPIEEAETSVDCTKVPEFPKDIFKSQNNLSKVYLKVEAIEKDDKNFFVPVGFVKYVTVFGVRIIGTENVKDEVLVHSAKVLAKVLDNDSDGKVDLPKALENVASYNTIIGYVTGPEGSDTLWNVNFRKDEAETFRNHFVCNMHFFEQWESDASIDFHHEMTKALSNDKIEKCDEFEKIQFDWPLWYLPFTYIYYGLSEEIDSESKAVIEKAYKKADESGKFSGNYTDDHDMQMTDYLVWSMLTVDGVLQCHCNSAVIEGVWSFCEESELEEFDPEYYKTLKTIKGLPRGVHKSEYMSKAVE